jgi:hypothetical protein
MALRKFSERGPSSPASESAGNYKRSCKSEKSKRHKCRIPEWSQPIQCVSVKFIFSQEFRRRTGSQFLLRFRS